MAQNLSDIRRCLASNGLRPKHKLGQNFLHDGNQMNRILEAAQIKPGELVLEIGAGTGGLSQRLLEAGARLVAVEVDRDLRSILHGFLSPFGDRVTLVIGDALCGKHAVNPDVAEALKAHAERTASPAGPIGFKLVANLPYHIACPLLANLIVEPPGGQPMDQAVVMVQREVADRLCARCGQKDYGALSVLVQAMAIVERVGTVGPRCFWPQPKVESAVVRLRRRRSPLTDRPRLLGATATRLFGQRRKQLGSILGRDNEPLLDGVDRRSRPEQLTIEQFVLLSRRLDQSAGC